MLSVSGGTWTIGVDQGEQARQATIHLSFSLLILTFSLEKHFGIVEIS